METVIGGRFISLVYLIVASQGPFLAVTSKEIWLKAAKHDKNFFGFLILDFAYIIYYSTDWHSKSLFISFLKI